MGNAGGEPAKGEKNMAHIKNRLRGLLAAFVALVAALAIAPGTALADPITGGDVTITNVEPGDQVYLYQVVKTDVNTTNNEATNSFVTDFGIDFDEEWAASNTAADPDTTDEVEGYANTIAQYVNENAGQWGATGFKMYGPVSATAAGAVFNDVDAGQYLVVVESANDATRVYQNTIVTVMPEADGADWVEVDVSADLKYTDMTPDLDGSVVDKKINGQDAVDNVDTNDTVTFTITAPVPKYVDELGTRVYKLTDTMDDGFVYVADSLEVKVGGTTLTAGDDYTLGSADGFFGTIQLTGTALNAYANQTLTVTYKATLAQDGNAPVYSADESNSVVLEFSINSVDEETSTDDDTVWMTVYGITFKKVNGDKDALEGAEFTIKDADGNELYTGLKSGANGVVTLNGALAAGQKYTLVETKAPAGYKPIADLAFTITSSGLADDGTYTGSLYEVNGGEIVDEESNFFTELPTTGGAGTVAMTAAGVVLVAGAAAFIVRSRKEN